MNLSRVHFQIVLSRHCERSEAIQSVRPVIRLFSTEAQRTRSYTEEDWLQQIPNRITSFFAFLRKFVCFRYVLKSPNGTNFPRISLGAFVLPTTAKVLTPCFVVSVLRRTPIIRRTKTTNHITVFIKFI